MFRKSLPRLIITGATGFVGRHLLDILKEHAVIFAIARRHPMDCNAPIHANIQWFQLDITDRMSLAKVFRRIHELGGADFLIHLAAYYDFVGTNRNLYWRTNVDGFKNIIDECIQYRLKRIVFASSLVACAFPREGICLTESSKPDGTHLYSKTKRVGEEMLREYAHAIPSCIIRFPAIFSDSCEYPPLFVFLETWLTRHPFSRILAGRGRSAVPYLHVRCVSNFIRTLIPQLPGLSPCEVLICSDDRCVSHRDLFLESTRAFFNVARHPVYMPRSLCWTGMHLKNIAGRITGNRPFEQPWMAEYIDRELRVDSSYSRKLTGWSPNPRYGILHRLPLMIETRKSAGDSWYALNHAALKKGEVQDHLRLHRLLDKHRDDVKRAFFRYLESNSGRTRLPGYHGVDRDRLEWDFTLFYRHLMNAVLTQEKSVFFAYCKDLAEHRYHMMFPFQEVADAIDILGDLTRAALKDDPESRDLSPMIQNCIGLTVRHGIDLVYDAYQDLD